jgi:beta-galactosidase
MKYFGAQYYPDYTPKADWEKDIRLMKVAGMNVTRMAESSWQNLEPEEGKFEFDWQDEAIQLFEKHEIKVILSTPTYIPPIWMIDKYPEILSVNENNDVVAPGARHHYCFNSIAYLEATDRIVFALGQHFGNHPNVIGWQIHNELGLSTCYCDRCLLAFHQWLEKKYTTIDQLNDEWLVSWSRKFTRFEQIPFPHRQNGEGGHILPLVLNHRQYRSDTIVSFQKRQYDILKPHVGDRWITHNVASGLYLGFNTYDLAEHMDVAGWDNYPDLQGGWRHASISHRLFRGLKSRPHWAMEQICGRIGNDQYAGASPAPGQISRWIWHTYALDGEGILFWLLRSKPGGNWPYWQGILLPNGQTSERYDELKQIGNQLKPVFQAIEQANKKPHAIQVPQPKVAIIFDYEDIWILEREKGDFHFSAINALLDLYQATAKWGLHVDVISSSADLKPYHIVLAPLLARNRDAMNNKLKTFVEHGGIVILGPRSGRYSSGGTLSLDTAPAGLDQISGIEVLDYDILETEVKFIQNTDEQITSKYWVDLIQPTTATPIASILHGRYKKRPLVTWNKTGQGGVFYCGGYLDSKGWENVIDAALAKANIQPYWRLPDDCEAIAYQSVTFLFNHSAKESVVYFPDKYFDLIEQKNIEPGLYWLKPEQTLALERISSE